MQHTAMDSVFCSDFTTSALSDWTVEQHVPDGYSDFVIRGGRLVLLDAGNRIMPNTPSLESFVMRGVLDADWGINHGEFSLRVFFAYDPHRRQGQSVEFGSDGAGAFARLTSPRGDVVAEAELMDAPVERGLVEFEMTVVDGGVCLKLNSRTCLTALTGQNCRGQIALTRGAFLGELRLRSLTIESDEPLEQEAIWTDLPIPFAPLNGMDIPIVWTVTATRVGTAARVEVELSGGEKTRPDVPWFPYHCHYVEVLDRPYLRIESARSVVELRLSDDALVLAIPHKEYFYSIAHQNPPWPFRKTFYLRDVPPGPVLFAGYEAYGNRAVNKHLEATSPYETVYEPGSERIVYSGPALRPGGLVLETRSPADKQLCRDLPPATVDYGRALAFAQANHYFTAGEVCVFQFEAFARDGATAEPPTVEYRVESAFFEPLTDYAVAELDAPPEALALDIRRLSSSPVALGALDPGVYHLRYRVRDGASVLQEHYRAFEVLGQTESGAAAARLPRCFSMSNEVKGQDTDYFDPWRADCADVSHYVSIAAGIMPHFARRKRLWELLRLYGREWFLWLGGRVMQDFALEHNRDLVQGCDYILPAEPSDVYYRPAARQFYHPQLMAILRDFARSTSFREVEISACAEAGTIPDKGTFDALVDECFYDWIAYFWARRIGELSQFRAEVSRISPHVRISSYGPVAVYGGIYKTAHACTYAGAFSFCPEMEAFRDGFFILEDYPHACRYSLHSGPFFLATFKARAPQVAVYPELYNETGDRVPCPDAAVARAWPSYGMWDGALPVNATLKHVLEYVYGCVWHNEEGFGYWQDHGFHTRVWERERFAGLLQLWGFVDKAPPRRPLRANAYVCNEDCCRNQRLYYDEYPGDGHEAYGDLFNTAEESAAYCYEMSRTAGQNAGFVTDFAHLSALSASDIDVLVLPPLTCVSADALGEVRRLHEAGVGLLGFEVVTGLEDLFGVTMGEPTRVHNIQVNEAVEGSPLSRLFGRQEYTEHRACVGAYQATGADVLLDAEAPVLFCNQTPSGRTALYNIPPTAVRRQDQFNRVAMGRASISPLINEATRIVLRHLSRLVVEATEGKIIAFEDKAGRRHIILAEDAHPLPARAIQSVVTINLPGLEADDIRCTRGFAVMRSDGRGIRLSVRLDPDEFAIISL